MSPPRVRSPFRSLVLVPVALLLLAAAPAAAEPLTLATWNVRILSDRSRDQLELEQIAAVLSRYEFVALQEVRDTVVLDRLLALLPEYTYIASPPVGRGVSERYAFFYRPQRISVVAPAALVADPDDLFIREPFVGHFRVERFDFTIVSIHVVYGDSIRLRRAEVAALPALIMLVDEENGLENDILLVGDFNLPADDAAWALPSFEPLVQPDVPTTITDSSSYDNIWFDPDRTIEIFHEVTVFRFDEELFGNDDRAASLAVSDHRPVRARFITTVDDD